MDEEFYITLPSNSSSKFYPDNETSHFTTKLAKPIQLSGSWVCGLVEVHYPLTWSKFYVEDAWLKYTSKNGIEGPYPIKITITEGYYGKGSDVINRINKSALDTGCSFEIIYKENTKTVLLKLGANAREIELSPNLARIE